MVRATVISCVLSVVLLASRSAVAATDEPAGSPPAEDPPLRDDTAEEDEEPSVVFTLPDATSSSPESADQIVLPESIGGRAADVPGLTVGGLQPFSLEETGADDPLGGESDRFRFPEREEWEDFTHRLNGALAAGSLERLVELQGEAQAALAALEAIPGEVEYARWLRERLNDMEIVQRSARRSAPMATGSTDVPLYDEWLEWMRDRPPPARAQEWAERLKPVFVSAEIPSALVWLAETESSFQTDARSPAGARGLFQLMPGTAREMGLRLRPLDERLDPMRNARSAARYLAQLQERFGDWPLTLAAYNAGPSRVDQLLKERRASTFAGIADGLPTETQLYVPRVLATLTVREGVTPTILAARNQPTARATAE